MKKFKYIFKNVVFPMFALFASISRVHCTYHVKNSEEQVLRINLFELLTDRFKPFHVIERRQCAGLIDQQTRISRVNFLAAVYPVQHLVIITGLLLQ